MKRIMIWEENEDDTISVTIKGFSDMPELNFIVPMSFDAMIASLSSEPEIIEQAQAFAKEHMIHIPDSPEE